MRRGNRKGGGGGGNNINRVYDSAGPEGKVRGTPQQIIDKYTTLARDAQTSGDQVTAENFLQHAEHYQRILIQAMGAQEQNRREQAAQNNEQPDVAPAPAADGGSGDKPAPAPAAVAGTGDQPAADIGGMAMIDSEPGQDSLLVESEEVSKSQPRRNGRSRPPKPSTAEGSEAPAAAEVKSGTDDGAPEAAAEG